VLAVLGGAQLAMHLVLTVLMGHSALPGGGMVLAHAGAVAVTALLLTHAESMLLLAVAGLRRLLPVVWRGAPVPAGRVPVPVCAPGDPLISVVLRRVHRRRGPPARS
jgi:hypothetical protein